jgi:hypothetical protein
MDNPVDNILIDNISFNYVPAGDPAADTDLNIRYPFISFELVALNATLSNLTINNCKFNHLNTGAVVTDIRPGIAIVNTYSALAGPTLPNAQQVNLINANITKNIGNRNQSIIITSRRDSAGLMNYPGLAAQGCNIKDNICGNIGYFISSAVQTVNLSPNYTSLPDKLTGLTIENNVCHYIYNCDEDGYSFLMSKLVGGSSSNRCAYPSGYVDINKNKANWIHVGCAYEQQSGLNITNNVLQAYSESYLNMFGANEGNFYGPVSGTRSFKYAIFVSTNKYKMNPIQSPSEGNDTSILISGNIVNQGYWYLSNGVVNNYTYTNGYIFCQGSSTITDNILRGAGVGNLILVGGLRNIIKGNKIYRDNIDVTSYIRFDNFDTPNWDSNPDGEGAGSQGLVVDNFFDKPTINAVGVTGSFNGLSFFGAINIPSTAAPGWIVERNKNQTGIAIVPWTNGHILYHTTGGSAFGPDGYDDLYMKPANNNPSGTFTGEYRSRVLRFRDTESVGFRLWGVQVNLEAFLPNGVRVLEVSSAIRSFGTQVDYNPASPPAATSNFWINLSSQDMQNIGVGTFSLDNFSTVSDNDDGVFEINNTVFSNVTGGDFNSSSLALPFEIDLTNYNGNDISNRYITGRGIGITLSLDARWARDSIFFGTEFLISPVLVTYRW